MANLDSTQQRLLENAPDNPNSPKKPETATVRPGLGFSKSISGPPKPSLRETMLAQKKAALANKNLPARPGSAMSSFSPVRSVSTSASSSSMSEAPVRSRPESSTVAHGGLSVAPVRPTRFRPAPRPELVARPATAGPYSVRRPGHAPSSSDSNASPTSLRAAKTRTPSTSTTSPPKRVPTRPNTSHSNHTSHSHSSHTSPAKSVGGRAPSRAAQSPRSSPPKSKLKLVASKTMDSSPAQESRDAREDENFSMVVPMLTNIKEPAISGRPQQVESSDEEGKVTPVKPLQVYEDPFSSTDDHTTPRPHVTAPVLEEVPVNDDVSNIMRNGVTEESIKLPAMTPERLKQNSRLLDSGITKIKAKSLDVHGFRKLQGLIRDNKVTWSDDKFDVLLLGLFEYLESTLTNLATEKALDVKAQILATIKLLFKKERRSFRPHIARGLDSILLTRSSYDSRTHIVSGLELLADEMVTLAEPTKTLEAIIARLQTEKMTTEGCRTLSMGLHVLRELLEIKPEFAPTDEDVITLCKLTSRCIDSSESGVRLDAVQLCVAIHTRVGEDRFWGPMGGIKDDSKSLITYYIVKRQREVAALR
jgi:CLIP-associating protein 1/2